MNGARPRRRGTRILRFVLGLIAVVVALALIGAVYQSRAAAADRARYAAPGDIRTVDGRAMHVQCVGEGSPTVVLDAGQGGWSTDWAELLPRIGETTRACAYDRAGYGWSEPADGPRDPQALADDLSALLDAVPEAPPYVLVGFSASGLSSRLVAAARPDEVAGLVLVDPATEHDHELLGEELVGRQRSAVGMLSGFELAARLGLVRALDPRGMAPYVPFLSRNPADPDVYYSFVSEPGWWRTSRAEFAARLDDAALARVRDHGPIPDAPVVVVAAEIPAEGSDPALHGVRLDRLRELAAESEQGRFVLAEGSSHEVLRDRPDVVIDAVLDVVDAMRSR